MYGMLNKAVEELARARLGDDGWTRVRTRAGFEHETFISMQPYDDGVTYALATEIAAELGVTVPALLEVLGEYWIDFAVRNGYGEHMQMHGPSLRDFLFGLDEMHTRLAWLPGAQPPSRSTATTASSTR